MYHGGIQLQEYRVHCVEVDGLLKIICLRQEGLIAAIQHSPIDLEGWNACGRSEVLAVRTETLCSPQISLSTQLCPFLDAKEDYISVL